MLKEEEALIGDLVRQHRDEFMLFVGSVCRMLPRSYSGIS
jgi:hypothetical protein